MNNSNERPADSRLRLLALWLRRESGQTLMEYALVLFLIAVGAVAILEALGGGIANFLSGIPSAL